ncbi:hypothetical protein VNI00_001137 [Paramarasmius palmivorus]|uniref:Uncharacterized protein n=1 Tax=Paramarasmius palmivorus TaxID=297713 RepID=A0AAW0E6M5_9AGAR
MVACVVPSYAWCSGSDAIPPAALQAQGIIQLPSPSKRSIPSTSKVDPMDIIEISDSDSDNELQRLQARVKELEAKRAHKRVKREPDDKTEVKQESIGTVIDLT